jgi:DNA-binding transcriptional ArsR family regulator
MPNTLQVLKALSDETRLRILNLLRHCRPPRAANRFVGRHQCSFGARRCSKSRPAMEDWFNETGVV